MTFYANRNNIKPKYWFITFVVMIFLCLFATSTLKNTGTGYFAKFNSIVYGNISIYFVGIILSELFERFLAFSACVVSFISTATHFSTFFCLLKFSPKNGITSVTLILISIFTYLLFVKFRKWFDFLAMRTLFCLNCFSHSLFPYKRLRSESVVGTYQQAARFILRGNSLSIK